MTATKPDVLEAGSLCEAFQKTAAANPDRIALRAHGEETEFTWSEYAAQVQRLAGGLAALGASRGDTIGLMMTNRPEFHLVDTAALHLGATPFSIYNTSAPEQIEYLFSNAANRIVVCEQQFAERVRNSAAAAFVEHFVCVDASIDGMLTLDDLCARGARDFDFESSWRAVDDDDVATLIYTSGTTGPPKGVELTHGSLLAELRALSSMIQVGPEDRSISFLPSAHIGDRMLSHYLSIAWGIQITSLPNMRELGAATVDVRPTFYGGVPRVWEKIMAGLQAAGVGDPHALPEAARTAVLEKIGLDHVRGCICGAAPIPEDTLNFFAGLGLNVQELWGMSELSCVATINPKDAIKVGTVGVPLPGVEIKVADDGEILCRGPIVMRGYRNEPEKTAETIDPDGWLHTGDIGEIDEDGYIRIVDRKKELIINAAGKNMSPANIEQKLKAASPLIGQAIAIGDARPFNTALIVLDPETAGAWAAEKGKAGTSVADLAADADLFSEIQSAVWAANERMARVEQIKRFTILPDEWLPGGDELTPTSKLKRKPIAAKYADTIDGLYG